MKENLKNCGKHCVYGIDCIGPDINNHCPGKDGVPDAEGAIRFDLKLPEKGKKIVSEIVEKKLGPNPKLNS